MNVYVFRSIHYCSIFGRYKTSVKAICRNSSSILPRMTPAHTAPAHTALAHTAPAHTAPAHTAPAHTAPAHTAPAHTVPAHTAPAHTAPAHTAPAHTAPAHTASAHLDSAALLIRCLLPLHLMKSAFVHPAFGCFRVRSWMHEVSLLMFSSCGDVAYNYMRLIYYP